MSGRTRERRKPRKTAPFLYLLFEIFIYVELIYIVERILGDAYYLHVILPILLFIGFIYSLYKTANILSRQTRMRQYKNLNKMS